MADEDKKPEDIVQEDNKPEEDKQPEEETKTEKEDNKPEEEPTEDKEDVKDGEEPSEDIDYSQKDKEEVADALKTKGFDYDTLVQEYATTGEISVKTRAELAKVGITGTIIDNYIVGMKAKAEQDYNEIAEVVGGREEFDKIIDWTAHNVDAEEIAVINSLTSKIQIKSYLRDLKARMENQEGKTPEYQKGSGDKTTTEMYRSQAEMFEAINNPKYKKDEAYRLDVQKKITASREAGVDLGIY